MEDASVDEAVTVSDGEVAEGTATGLMEAILVEVAVRPAPSVASSRCCRLSQPAVEEGTDIEVEVGLRAGNRGAQSA